VAARGAFPTHEFQGPARAASVVPAPKPSRTNHGLQDHPQALPGTKKKTSKRLAHSPGVAMNGVRPHASSNGTAKSAKMVYFFGKGKTEGNVKMKDALGGKGANLADMTSIGLPVPPGFTITTHTCAKYNEAGQKLPPALMSEVARNIRTLEQFTGKKFGRQRNALSSPDRSGAKVSMRGMMNTIHKPWPQRRFDGRGSPTFCP